MRKVVYFDVLDICELGQQYLELLGQKRGLLPLQVFMRMMAEWFQVIGMVPELSLCLRIEKSIYFSNYFRLLSSQLNVESEKLLLFVDIRKVNNIIAYFKLLDWKLPIYKFEIKLFIIMKDYSYLQTPTELYEEEPKQEDALINVNGRITRVIYYNVSYSATEMKEIEEFKRYAESQGKYIDCSNQDVLRYLYSTNFNHQDCMKKVDIFMDWCHNPRIQNVTEKTMAILRIGAVYTYGRDRKNRPIVVLDISKINLERFQIQDYYSAINTVLSIVVHKCFVKGVIENYFFMIDMDGKNFTSLSVGTVGNIISKLSIVYSMYLGQMAIIKAQYLIKLSYYALSGFIHAETRKKICLLDTGETEKLRQYIDPGQLYQKHTGVNPNPIQYWPPSIPGHHIVYHRSMDDSVYYSILSDNDSFFHEQHENENDQNQQSFCCETNNCVIF